MRPQRQHEHVMPGKLRPLSPFDELTSEQLIVAAGRAMPVRFQGGETVLARGCDDPDDYFLIDGNVVMSSSDGVEKLVAAGSPDALRAVATTRPCLYDVRAAGLATLARIPRTEVGLLRAMLDNGAEMSLEEMSANLSETRGMLFDLEADIAANRLKLPSLPDVALRIRDILTTSTCDNRRIAKLLSADPAAAAKILKIANSPLCRGVAVIDNLHDAVSRIGMHTVSELVICFSLKDLFDTSSPSIRHRFAELVGESVRIGAAASVIAERAGREDSERALVAGLLSNIGALPILEVLALRVEVVQDPSRADAAIAAYATRVGEMICRRWDLGEAITEAVREAGNWSYDSGEQGTLTDCVLCARYHAMLGLGRTRGLPKPDTIRAMRILGAELTPQVSLAIIKEAKARVDVLLDTIG